MLVEGEEPKPEISEYPAKKRHYHMALLVEAGLVDGVIRNDEMGVPNGSVAIRLTWSGHEFLDAARNETTWNKTTKSLKSQGVEIGFELLKTVLIESAKDKLRIYGLLPPIVS